MKPLVVSMDANGDGVLSVDEVRGAIQRSSGQAVSGWVAGWLGGESKRGKG